MKEFGISVLAFILAVAMTPVIKLMTWRELMLQDIREAEDLQKRTAAEDEARRQSSPRH